MQQLQSPPLNSTEQLTFVTRHFEKAREDVKLSSSDSNSGGVHSGGIIQRTRRAGEIPTQDWVGHFDNLPSNGITETQGRNPMETVMVTREGFASYLPSSSTSADEKEYRLKIVTTVGKQCIFRKLTLHGIRFCTTFYDLVFNLL